MAASCRRDSFEDSLEAGDVIVQIAVGHCYSGNITPTYSFGSKTPSLERARMGCFPGVQLETPGPAVQVCRVSHFRPERRDPGLVFVAHKRCWDGKGQVRDAIQ